MSESVYIVDEYSDSIRCRTLKRVVEDEAWRTKWGHKILPRFDSREQALQFMVGRAHDKLVIAQKTLKAAEKRVRKCEKLLEHWVGESDQEQASQRVEDPEAPDQQQCFVDPKVLKIGLGE